MTFTHLRNLLKQDQFRYNGGEGLSDALRQFVIEPGFRYTVFFRLAGYLRSNPLTRFGVYHMVKLLHRHYSFRYGVHIDISTEIGGGLYLPHVGAIVVNRRCVIGRNCNLSHQVTLGVTNRGNRKGCPVVGDSVYIGPGAKIIGGITVGDHVAIGANSVVTRNIEAGAVVVGIPGRVISHQGSEGYVNLVLPH